MRNGRVFAFIMVFSSTLVFAAPPSILNVSLGKSQYILGEDIVLSGFWVMGDGGETVKLMVANSSVFSSCSYSDSSGCLTNSSPTSDSPVNATLTQGGGGRIYPMLCDSTGECDKHLPDVKIPGGLLAEDSDVVVMGESISETMGSVSTSCDFNGDGVDDVLLGSNQYGSAKGSSLIFYGSASLASIINESQRDVRIDGVADWDFSSNSVAAGDVDGDGVCDVVVGAYNSDSSGLADAGTTYIVYGGSLSGVISLSEADVTVEGNESSQESGASVHSLDFNGDGYFDLLVGAPHPDPSLNGFTGKAYLTLGGSMSSQLSLSQADAVFSGVGVDDRTGNTVGSLDFNGDGFDDAFIGAGYADTDGGNAGRAYIVFGGPSVGGD